MLVPTWILCLAAAMVLGSPPVDELQDKPPSVTHIIDPPGRCPSGMMPDRNGHCRLPWPRQNLDIACLAGQEPDADGLCRQTAPANCVGDNCPKVILLEKRDVGPNEREERGGATEQPVRLEALQSEKRSKKRSRAARRERSKHAFLMMLKKKKMQMMKPKPPAPPPPHHPPHHHPPHHEDSEEEPEEEPPAEEDTPAPERMFFADEPCTQGDNSTGGCPPDAEVVENVEANDDFKEWKPQVSSESSESSESSSSSDSTADSGSAVGSGESEDEVLQKALKIKMMKLFRMKQRYGPALRRWLVSQLREYEDSFDY